MGILIIRIWIHIRAVIKKALYKIVYGRQIRFGKKFCFRRNFFLFIDKGAKVSIGDNSYFSNDVSINCLERITIGKRCLLGENVKLYDHNHKFRDFDKTIAEQGFTTKPITIGDDCWFGSNVTVLQGVTIGNHCVIGANCLIFNDIPDNTLVTSDAKIQKRPIKARPIENKGE